jgi:hypothetical protein
MKREPGVAQNLRWRRSGPRFVALVLLAGLACRREIEVYATSGETLVSASAQVARHVERSDSIILLISGVDERVIGRFRRHADSDRSRSFSLLIKVPRGESARCPVPERCRAVATLGTPISTIRREQAHGWIEVREAAMSPMNIGRMKVEGQLRFHAEPSQPGAEEWAVSFTSTKLAEDDGVLIQMMGTTFWKSSAELAGWIEETGESPKGSTD